MKKKANLPSISRIKKALYADWSLRVRTRDGFKCLLCGATENLTSHHWFVSDHFAHCARYAIANGATLCYACHIRGIHSRADYTSIMELANVMFVENHIAASDMLGMEVLIKTELTTPLYRELWDAMRKRVIQLPVLGPYLSIRGNKVFLNNPGLQIAVVGNVIHIPWGHMRDGDHEVIVVSKVEDGYRYTLKRLEEDCE